MKGDDPILSSIVKWTNFWQQVCMRESISFASAKALIYPEISRLRARVSYFLGSFKDFSISIKCTGRIVYT